MQPVRIHNPVLFCPAQGTMQLFMRQLDIAGVGGRKEGMITSVQPTLGLIR